jgi:hypothetical protein
MQDFKTVIVLSGVALLLAGGVTALASVNPYILFGLPPVLLAIAAIVRAIAGAGAVKSHGKAGRKGRRPPAPRS